MCIVLQTMAHELEQESLLRDNQTDRQVKALEAAAAQALYIFKVRVSPHGLFHVHCAADNGA